MIPSLQELCDFAAETAYRAGRFTLAHFGCGVATETKADRTPVTEADRGAERLIREAIEKAYPAHGILGEEFGELPGVDIRWVVDPIDGTKAFVRGLPTYATLIAAEIGGEPKVGLAYFPALDEMVVAGEGLGARIDSRPARTSSVATLAEAQVLAGEMKLIDEHDRGEAFRRVAERAGMVRTQTDAYGHILVATGRAEAMLDPIISYWDVAALYPILREAGGTMSDWSGGFERSRVEALSTNGVVTAELLALIA